jgi:hypothetical protein
MTRAHHLEANLTPRKQKRRAATSLVALGAAAAAVASCSVLGDSPSGSLLFQDDFSRTASGWDRLEGAGFSADYRDGGYHLRVDQPNGLVWGTPRFELRDVRLEVDSQPIAGPIDNAYGLICRYRDPDNFLFFLISSDGFAGIGAVQDGERAMLTASAMLPSDAILQGASPNHLRADCVGPRLSFFVNGVPAGEALVQGEQAGDVGVIAGSYAEAGVEIRFDNFVVLAP